MSQSQLRMLSRCPGRERPQQRGDRSLLPVERQTEQVVREEPGCTGPVSGRERVPDGLDDLPVVGEPMGGPAVKIRNLIAQPSADLQAQEIRQKLVVSKPGALSVEGHDERVGILQLQQHLLRSRAVCQQVAEFAAYPV